MELQILFIKTQIRSGKQWNSKNNKTLKLNFGILKSKLGVIRALTHCIQSHSDPNLDSNIFLKITLMQYLYLSDSICLVWLVQYVIDWSWFIPIGSLFSWIGPYLIPIGPESSPTYHITYQLCIIQDWTKSIPRYIYNRLILIQFLTFWPLSFTNILIFRGNSLSRCHVFPHSVTHSTRHVFSNSLPNCPIWPCMSPESIFSEEPRNRVPGRFDILLTKCCIL